jgi:uncharacterized protein (TIGR02246 family)
LALAALLALLVGGALLKSLTAQESKKPSQDEQAIRQAVTAYADAFSKGDLDQLTAYWDPEAEHIDESGKITQGRDAIVALLRNNLRGLKGCKLAMDIKSVRLITPEVALEDGQATLTKPDDTVTTPYTAVWVKKDGHWKLRSIRDLPEGEEPAPTTPAERLKGMEWVIGDWQSVEATPAVSLNCHWAPNKSFLLFDYHIKSDKDETSTTMRIGWDPVNEQFHSWYFDSAGGYGEGSWTRDGKTWVSETTGVLPDARIGTARYIVRFVDDKTWQWQSRNRAVDGRPLADVDVRFVRKTN